MLMGKKEYDEWLSGNIFIIKSKLHSANCFIHEKHLYKKYAVGMIYDWGIYSIRNKGDKGKKDRDNRVAGLVE